MRLVSNTSKTMRIMAAVHVDQEIMKLMATNTGSDVWSLSVHQGVMLVFLRHFGCIFCRQGLTIISEKRPTIEERGVKIVFVHMATGEVADEYFEQYQIPEPIYVNDPECRFYTAFGLTKGTFTQLFGLHTWIRGFQAGMVEGHSIGPRVGLGDDFQMPGVFLIQNGAITEAFVHKRASDQPDYDDLLRNCCDMPEAIG